MTPFDVILVADWSARASPSPERPSPNAIWIGAASRDGPAPPAYHRTRAAAEAALMSRLDGAVAAGERVLLGLDFAFGYPAGFAAALTGHAHAFAVWDWLDAELTDGPDNANDRFALADRMNARFPGTGPFWGRPEGLKLAHLPMTDCRGGHGVATGLRATERAADGRPQSTFKLAGAGAVGSQSLVGLPMLARLRRRYEGRLGVWPFEDHATERGIVLAEVYPSLIPLALAADEIADAAQVRTLSAALWALQEASRLAPLLARPEAAALHEEGWILGVGHEAALREAAGAAGAAGAARPSEEPSDELPEGLPSASALRPPPLRNDCFALPAGVDWVPVDDALARLRSGLHAVTPTGTVETGAAAGRVLAADVVARRANPPAPNAAVDGFGFAAEGSGVAAGAAGSAEGRAPTILPLHPGRAAAGAPFDGRVPAGRALRILTGAMLPDGVDTVVLEEDCSVAAGQVAFAGPVKPGSNTRRAGEDVAADALALPAGHVLRAPDLALLSALGVAEVAVRGRLRVGVLSTGDEIVPPGTARHPRQINDANRPMLLALAHRWGHAPVDLGIAPDDRSAVRDALDRGAAGADAILTSGGASAGDEDHVSAILRAEGTVAAWRIALKPGRPLMLGHWRGVPVFGMPGNPVAALVCALIFARPALAVLAGAEWTAPDGFTVPAAFAKRKKPGRREYLRARLDARGHAEVFASEGSGRISGLAWATGLVEIGDAAGEIAPGDPVRFLPYASFGL